MNVFVNESATVVMFFSLWKDQENGALGRESI